MKRMIAFLPLALAALPLSGCVEGPYRYGVGMEWHSHPYDVWYDGYYGPFYDGYWGSDGYFYFRLDIHSRSYRRGHPDHFRRYYRGNDRRFRRYEGKTKEPPRGTRMPSYPPRAGDRDRDYRNDRDRDYDRDRDGDYDRDRDRDRDRR